MLTVLVQRHGTVEAVEAIDPAWLDAGAVEVVWVDIEAPGEAERRLLLDVFHIHELAVEDALADLHFPKIETYDALLYLILHGIASGATSSGFETQDVDFFVGRNFLITVHNKPSRSIDAERAVCLRH